MNTYISQQQFDALEKRVEKLEAKFESAHQASMSLTKKPKSIGEFILEKSPKSHRKQCVCLMYFREIVQNASPNVGFTSNDVENAFGEARKKPPKNVSDVLAKCAKAGWIMKSGNKGGSNAACWVLTNTGIRYVEQMGEDKA